MKREFDYTALLYLDPLAFKLLEFARYNSLSFEDARRSVFRALNVQALIAAVPEGAGRFVLRLQRYDHHNTFEFENPATGERFTSLHEYPRSQCEDLPPGRN